MRFYVRNIIVSIFALLVAFGGQAQRGYELRDSVLIISGDLQEIEPYEFMYNNQIKEIKFSQPSKLQKIGASAFAWCESLERVELPASLKDLAAHSFAYCGKLREVVLPEGLEHIGNNAFSRCSSLEKIEMPANLKELASYAFSDCRSLRSAVMPANPNLLGELIFSGCYALQDLWELSPVPPKFDCESFIFEPDETGLYRQCRLHVPANSENLYRNAPGWKLFLY